MTGFRGSFSFPAFSVAFSLFSLSYSSFFVVQFNYFIRPYTIQKACQHVSGRPWIKVAGHDRSCSPSAMFWWYHDRSERRNVYGHLLRVVRSGASWFTEALFSLTARYQQTENSSGQRDNRKRIYPHLITSILDFDSAAVTHPFNSLLGSYTC